MPIEEGELATQLGIQRAELEELRQALFEDEDWVLVKGRVHYTEKGEAEIRRRLGLEDGIKNGAGQQDAPRQWPGDKNGATAAQGQPTDEKNGAGEREADAGTPGSSDGDRGAGSPAHRNEEEGGEMKCDLVVVRVCPNPIWVECKKTYNGEKAMCRVTWNGRMRRGMNLDGCLVERDHYVYPRRILK